MLKIIRHLACASTALLFLLCSSMAFGQGSRFSSQVTQEGALTNNSNVSTIPGPTGPQGAPGVPANGAAVCATFGIVCVDGVTNTCDSPGFLKAIMSISMTGGGTVDARACGGTITLASTLTLSVPINLLLDSSTLVLNGSPGISCPASGFGSTIQGGGETNVTIKSTSSTADMFSVACSNFAIKDLDIQMANTVGRTGSNAVFAITNAQGLIQHVRILGPSGVNGGDIVRMPSNTVTTWTFRDITVVGGATWTDGWFAQAASGTVSGLFFDNIQFFNSTFTGQVFNWDTGVDTVVAARIQSGATGIIVHTQNTLAGQAPRWIHYIDSRLECSSSANAILQLDTVRDFRYLDGYMATCQNAAVIGASATKVDISHNVIVNILQHGITLASGSQGVIIDNNSFEDIGNQTTNTYDVVQVAAGTQDFEINGNTFTKTVTNAPRYGVNLLAGSTSAFRILSNDFGIIAWGTAAVNNGATGSNQIICWNTSAGGCSLQDSSGGLTINPNFILNGTITRYNGVGTGGTGVAPNYGIPVNLTAQVANLGATTIYTTLSGAQGGAGEYRVCVTTWPTVIGNTTALQANAIAPSGAGTVTVPVGSVLNTAALTNGGGGCTVIHAAASSAIQVSTTGYNTTGTYSIQATAEQVQ